MSEPKSFNDLIVATAYQKKAAAEARRHPDPTAEKPRDAIIAGLTLVADNLAQEGFVLWPNRLKLSRKDGDLRFEIAIQSDRNNVAGRLASIRVHAGIYSKKVTAWRRRHASYWIQPTAPFPLPFFGNQIGYFGKPSGWLDWDFADPIERPAVAEDLTRTIRDRVLPVFAAFDGTPEDVAALAHRDWTLPELMLNGILIWLLANGQQPLAQQTLLRYLADRPEVRADFDRLISVFATEGLPEFRSLSTPDIAAFAVATGFPWIET
ncbi:MAG: hypothetical protein ACTHJR_04340 [Sphingomonas sp.]|uniref:hypothetical protein n=1 Tax=Sphingomonas sp. TaxID=28214 RepID=UPI003F7F12D9